MRKIFFRGFQPDENGNQKIFINGKWIKGYWVYGWFVGGCNKTFFSAFEESSQIIDSNGYWHEVIPETVGQFTGLYDGTKFENLTTEQQGLFLYPKNGGKHEKQEWKGNLIFEGDIVLHGKQKDFIFYDEELAAFVCKDSFQKGASWLYTHDCEVIGNIFENPELLEVHHD